MKPAVRILVELIRKELAQFRRDRLMMVIILVSPVFQLTILGLAANFDLQEMPVTIYDLDRSQAGRELADGFFHDDKFVRIPAPEHERELEQMLDRGIIAAALIIPDGFAGDLYSGVSPYLQFISDGSDPIGAGLAGRAAASIVGNYVARSKGRTGSAATGVAGGAGWEVAPRVSVWYNPSLESRNFFVPGILALVLMVISMLLTSISIVKEKEAGTLEQLIVSPLLPGQIIAGKLLPYAAIGFFDMMLVLAVAIYGFGVVPAGSLALLIGLSLVFILTTLGLGLFVSTVSATQQEAMMTAMFFVMLPMMFLSGFVFPIDNMPMAVQWLTYLLPLRYYFSIIRGIFLRGVGLEILWPDALALLVFGAVVLCVSVLRFRKRLD